MTRTRKRLSLIALFVVALPAAIVQAQSDGNRDVLRIQLGAIENVPRARMPVRVPVVLSRDEVARIMKHLDGVA